jgi:hypothetical protein
MISTTIPASENRDETPTTELTPPHNNHKNKDHYQLQSYRLEEILITVFHTLYVPFPFNCSNDMGIMEAEHNKGPRGKFFQASPSTQRPVTFLIVLQR